MAFITYLDNMDKLDFIKSVSLEKEDWKFLDDSSKKYAISSLGRVLSFKSRKPKFLSIVVQELRGRKYGHVCINSQKVRVHRLVAQLFVPNPEHLNEIDHINNDSLDNRACNLQYCTHAQNMRNPYTRKSERKYRLEHPFEMRGKYPRNIDISKFHNYHEDKMKAILQLKNGIVIARYKSLGEAERNGYKKTSISAALKGRLKTYRNCQWVLASDYIG